LLGGQEAPLQQKEGGFGVTLLKTLIDRHNQSKANDITSFPVTFVMSGCGNSSVEIKTIPGHDHGCDGKIYELSADYLLVAKPDASNPRERLCDTSAPERARIGEFDGELFFWATQLHQTVTPDVIKERHFWPLPPTMKGLAKTAKAEAPENEINDWFDRYTVACTLDEADEVKTVNDRCKNSIGKLDATVWAAACKTQKNGQQRKTGADGKRPYVHCHRFLDAGGKRGPMLPVKMNTN
jgi:hypothetical protein